MSIPGPSQGPKSASRLCVRREARMQVNRSPRHEPRVMSYRAFRSTICARQATCESSATSPRPFCNPFLFMRRLFQSSQEPLHTCARLASSTHELCDESLFINIDTMAQHSALFDFDEFSDNSCDFLHSRRASSIITGELIL